MDCNKWNEQLNDYLDGLLSAEEAKAFEAHMDSCASCREEFYLYKDMMAVLASTEDVKVPDGFHADLMEKVEVESDITSKVTQEPVEDKKIIPLRKRIPRSFVNLAAGLVLVTVLVLFGNQFNQYTEDSAMYESAEEAPAATEKSAEMAMEKAAAPEEAAPKEEMAVLQEEKAEPTEAAIEETVDAEMAAEPALMMEAPAEESVEKAAELPAEMDAEMVMEASPEINETAVVEEAPDIEPGGAAEDQLEMADALVEEEYSGGTDAGDDSSGTDGGSSGATSDDGRDLTLKTSAPEEDKGLFNTPWMVFLPILFVLLVVGALAFRFRKNR